MTQMEAAYRYGATPGEAEIRALDALREVYGIRRLSFDHQQRLVRVEYDASRMKEPVVAGLLRRAGIDVQEKVMMV